MFGGVSGVPQQHESPAVRGGGTELPIVGCAEPAFDERDVTDRLCCTRSSACLAQRDVLWVRTLAKRNARCHDRQTNR